jgi:hypothetical protein
MVDSQHGKALLKIISIVTRTALMLSLACGGQAIIGTDAMPKLTERERLADLEQRQTKLSAELDQARRALRGKYASFVMEQNVEALTEREFRDIVAQAIRAGGPASLAALKAVPARAA